MKQKLATLLGVREKTEKSWQSALVDMISKFTGKQGLFKGIIKTYQPLEGFADDPGKRGAAHVSSTVEEQMAWLKENAKEHVQITFDIEATNASGNPKGELVVDGESWGIFSSLELLRLKSFLDGKIQEMIKLLPVRSDAILWKPSQNPIYVGRKVYEDDLDTGFARTTLKEQYILQDPHPDKNRAPQVASKDTIVNIAKYTSQNFSGEILLRERADMLVRHEKLQKAVIAALEEANGCETVTSAMPDKLLKYLLG